MLSLDEREQRTGLCLRQDYGSAALTLPSDHLPAEAEVSVATGKVFREVSAHDLNL